MGYFLVSLLALYIVCKPKKKKKKAPVNLKRFEKEQEKAKKEAERERIAAEKKAERERKATAERQQAAADKDFYIEQIDKLNSMLWELDEELQAAKEKVKQDLILNKYGAVVPEKIAAKHRADRDKIAKKVMQIENSIHAKETKLNKALHIIESRE